MTETHALQLTLSEQQALDLQLAVTTFLCMTVPEDGRVLSKAVMDMDTTGVRAFTGAMMLALLGGKPGEISGPEAHVLMRGVCERLTDLGVVIAKWHKGVLIQRRTT